MRRSARTAVSAALVAAAALGLAGCAPARTVELGATQEVTLRSPDTDAKAEIAVVDVVAAPVAAYPEDISLPDSYADGTLFFVTYEATLTEGDPKADDTYPLSHYNWGATGADGAEVATVQTMLGGYGPDCPKIDSDLANLFAHGETITACQLFASETADALLAEVVYGQPMISRRGNGGWTWTIP